MGGLCQAKENSKKVIECFEEVLKIKDDNSDIWFDLGINYNKEGETNKSIQSYKRAIELKPDMYLAHIYLIKGKYGKVFKTYKLSFVNYDIQQFFDDYDSDFQYLEQYGLKKSDYFRMKEKLMKNLK